MQPTTQLTQEFIEVIWNQQRFDQLPRFLHAAFHDHSLPATLPPTAAGLQAWIAGTNRAFRHHTTIDDQVTEGTKTMLKIRLHLTHVGDFRGIAATGHFLEAVGYRFFELREGRICHHWALLDGNAIETQLTAAAHGCKLQE